MKLVGESVTDAFERFGVQEDRQYHTCYNCGLREKYESVEYIKGYVVFKGKSHSCDREFWGAKAIPISDKEKEYWNKTI